MTSIPSLDIRRFDSDRDAFIQEMGSAFQKIGFCSISGHGISRKLIEEAYKAIEQFFALPLESKLHYQLKGKAGARGYTPLKIETAKGHEYADMKEFYHVGREIPRDSKYAELMPANLWPEEIPEFRNKVYTLYESLDHLGNRILSVLALFLGLPGDFFEDKVDSGNSLLRLLHYPAIVQDNIPNMRAAAHEDINLITLLVGAEEEGLEVLAKDHTWVPVSTNQDEIVVNMADMLQRLTNNVYISTSHRVVNPTGDKARKPRYSMPFFLQPNPDMCLDPLDCCITEENPCHYSGTLTSFEYLMQRLREIKMV
ncbi:hypothetical protein MYAM1_003718 [Malassezia yamatoensis]|uniref:Fe2OG dioxygenase domain-containing protein n=1 Tax=Malassezia yamatoensis TaxID=253288 RepID=A0AAJ6CKP9_9BASI|nr:hypothetical protein MYAM1_003718 [Malassezia yamatoensis]